MSRSSKIATLAILLLASLLFLDFLDPKPVQIIRAATFDYYQRVLPRDLERLPVTIVDIDEKSLNEIGQWPWPRSVLVELIENLVELSALVIGFDMVFPETDRLSPDNIAKIFADQQLSVIINKEKLINNDALFAESISSNSVVLGTMLSTTSRSNSDITDSSKAQINSNKDPKSYIPQLSSRISNLPEFEQSTDSIGVLTLLPEVDGVVRRIPTLYHFNGQVWPSFGVELLRSSLRAESIDIQVDQAGINSVTIAGIKLPTNEQGLTWLQFNSHQKTRYISAVDIINGEFEPASLMGHMFLVGTSASGLHDIKMTPMAQQMPGVEVWAQWLESALFGELLERPNYAWSAEMLFLLFSGLVLILLTKKASARLSLVVYLFLTVACMGFSWWMYKNKLLFDASFPVISIGVLFACLMLMKFWHEEQQRKQIKNAFSYYLSPEIVNELAANPKQLKLGGESREITSLFTDLQGFTGLSESLEPEGLVDIINQYLDGVCRVVIQHNGTIDKIVGDAVHVIFSAPKLQKNHADLAVECGLQIDAFCRKFRQDKQKRCQLGETRIGINSGYAVVGNFGGEQRFDYTAYGDAINTAARLESANQYLGTTICVADSTKRLCKRHVFRPVADLTVKGKTESIMVYEPLAPNSKIHSYLEKYQDIFNKVQRQDSAAIEMLEALSNKHPDDTAMKLLLDHQKVSSNVGIERVLLDK